MTNKLVIEAVNQIEIEKYNNREWFTVIIFENKLVKEVFEVKDSTTAIQKLNKFGQKLTKANRDSIKRLIKN